MMFFTFMFKNNLFNILSITMTIKLKCIPETAKRWLIPMFLEPLTISSSRPSLSPKMNNFRYVEIEAS